jgi:hypothetical protein
MDAARAADDTYANFNGEHPPRYEQQDDPEKKA